MSDSAPRWLAGTFLFMFAAIAAICLWLPVNGYIELIGGIEKGEPKIVFDKGIFYLFGAGAALLALLPDGISNVFLRRKIGRRISKWVTRSAAAGIVLMIVVPHLIHWSLSRTMEDRQYTVCEAESDQWLFVRTIVYAQRGHCGND